jgi:tetrahydrodipicolinate N-succinyltransferase
MNENIQLLDAITLQVEGLIKENIALKKQVQGLESEQHKLSERLSSTQSHHNQEIQNTLISSVIKGFENNKVDTLDMKRKINEFVREIDKCINLLSKY